VVALALSMALGAVTSGVFAANVNVNSSSVFDEQHALTVGELTLSQCAAETSILNGADGSSLIGAANVQNAEYLGNAGTTMVNGGKGSDCMVPGATTAVAPATLNVNGGQAGGTDICFYGPSAAARYSFSRCSGPPVAYGTPYITGTTNAPAFS
jgi:hypothetical protein